MTENVKRSKGKKDQKSKGKSKGKSAPKGPKTLVPAFLYISKCCNAIGKKQPCARGAEGKSDNTLGCFRCSACNKSSSFNRQVNTNKETVSV